MEDVEDTKYLEPAKEAYIKNIFHAVQTIN